MTSDDFVPLLFVMLFVAFLFFGVAISAAASMAEDMEAIAKLGKELLDEAERKDGTSGASGED